AILQETYGVIVYQEQVMQISQVLAGYSLGRADLLRRAMGKKKAEEMAKERVGFLEGCRKEGVDEAVAGSIFDMMEKFAAYGFNKSHSAAYGLLTVQTAWLKAHYPVEFMAALLTSEAANTDKVVAHIFGARQAGIEVLSPDVNESASSFTAHPPRDDKGKGRIRFGLGAVKGVGDSAVEAILAARAEGGPFESLFDFCSRIDPRRVNKKVIEALVKSGAFDFEGVPRWQLMAGIDAALSAGSSAHADRQSGQASLFGAMPVAESRPRYPQPGERVGDVEVSEWPERVRLAAEKEALGFYITGHPLAGYEKEARRYASTNCLQVQHKRQGDKVSVVGVVRDLRERQNKDKGTRFGFFALEDVSGSVEVICWGGRPASGARPAQKGWADWEMLVKGDEPLLVHGEVRINQRDEEHPTAEIVATDIELLSQVRNQKTSEVALRIDADRLRPETVGQLRALLGRHPGACAVTVRAVIPERSETRMKPKERVTPSDDFIEAARRLGFEVELR
ncbi:MAG TPA: OB-fold nucleic acid binding domain-containing protein, partial [Anaeromyxobacteraceae bacterium]|nr:OB-fold nucleic acid binding domain-containing protein [Anaeromyxobacteraceae bacterium]